MSALTNSLNAHAEWCRRRHAELSAPDSWLGLIGLYWLEEGGNRVGSDERCPIRLPAGAPFLGELRLSAGVVSWQANGETEMVLQTDRNGTPSTLTLGNFQIFIVDRDGRLAARVRDLNWAEQRVFTGVACRPYDPAWVIEAEWQRLEPPLLMTVPNVSGELKEVVVDQQAVATVDGLEFALLPMSVSESEIFFVFRDRTSGRESYGAGRFLKTGPAVAGRVILDFNRAYNPPCAFTPFATCPLPPAENCLPFAVPVGELKPSDH